MNINKELNINNLDGENFSDTSDANNDDDNVLTEPVMVRSPVIQITHTDNVSEPNKTLSHNLNKDDGKLHDIQKLLLANKQDILPQENQNVPQRHSPNKSAKSSPKIKSKTKPKDKAVKVKNKFSESSLELIAKKLKGHIFSGWVGEREYVENLRAYRDIIEVDEWEDDMNSKLKIVMHGVKGVMEGTRWINITVPSSHSPCYCLWVLLDSAPCPGHYWMQILDISASDPQFGLKISLKILREVNSFDGETIEQRGKRQKGDLSPDEWKEWALSLMNFNLKSLFASTLALLTPSNIGNGFRLIVVLTVTLVVAGVTFMRYSWEFLLRFMREFGIFIHHATPFAESIIRFFEKIVGGFYLLIAMVYRDLRRPPPPCPVPMEPNHLRMLGPPPNSRAPCSSVAFVPSNNWVFHEDDVSD